MSIRHLNWVAILKYERILTQFLWLRPLNSAFSFCPRLGVQLIVDINAEGRTVFGKSLMLRVSFSFVGCFVFAKGAILKVCDSGLRPFLLETASEILVYFFLSSTCSWQAQHACCGRYRHFWVLNGSAPHRRLLLNTRTQRDHSFVSSLRKVAVEN